MNFLAHAFLSGNNEDIILGNFIADHVKGKAIERYNDDIRVGIYLHRRIDSFTDSHPIVRKSINRLKDRFGRYSGVIVDMFYDHLLASNWKDYSSTPLKEFTLNIYRIILNSFTILPPRTRKMIPYMIEADWLASYAQLQGLHKALSLMSERTKYISRMEYATEALIQDYQDYKNEFLMFFEDIRKDTASFFIENEL